MNLSEVMLIDDDRVVLKSLRRQVENLGFSCRDCSSAEQALELRNQGSAERILICDWQLPGMSGLDLCRKLRQEKRYTYILLLTGTEGPEAKFQALDAGADAFLAKPASSADLRAHLQIGQRILALQANLEARLEELESANQELVAAEASRDRLRRQAQEFEEKVAAQVQNRLLMGPPPPDPCLDIATFNQASREVDGDFVDFFHRRDGLDMVVGDVMGKGIPAALLGAGIKTQLLRTLAEAPEQGLEEVITHLNQRIASDLISLNSFVTLFYARFEIERARLLYVDAGHTKPLLRRSDTGKVFRLEGPNVPLGFCHDEVYECLEQGLSLGDTVVLYSDGLTEAVNDRGEEWGPTGLCQALEQCLSSSAQEVLQGILRAFEGHRAPGQRADDISLVVATVRRLPAPGERLITLECPCELASLERIRQFIDQSLIDSGSPARSDEVWSYQLLLAVTELASNLLRHAYEGKSGQWMQVLLSLSAEEVRVRLYHRGIPMNQPLVCPKIESPQEGGMGIFLVQQSTDSLEYGSDRQVHWVEISKRCPSAQSANSET